ncbi:MAG: hypothetical protein EBR51_02930, partial [Gammaproteobacteria bacterium]|nr:hypothetical protein [Gammaproteobacteria bacterium]
NFESCWWLLAASPGVEIRISFHEFKTERSYDFVTISRCSDAECAQHTQILKHSGRMSAGSVYTSTTGFLKVSFTSDHSITDDGVLANWSLSGTEGCIACSAGKYSAALGASTAAACVSCPQASSSPSGSTLATDCKCHAGHSGADGGPCAPCAAGKYKPDAGAAPCTTCPAGKYSAPGAGACSSCPESASSPSGSTLVTDCKCGAGHSGADGGPCAPCAAGKYKPDAGAAPCTTCPAGKYSAPGAGTCSNCPESASSPSGSTRVTDCKCAAGHSGADGGPCTAVLPSTPGAQRGDSTGAWFAALACVAVVCVGLGFMCTRLSLYTRVSTVEGVRL